ncbi:hypothetical protein [Caulobacter sp. Root1455]|uniref:hypothetical protein n=1 Tax=Caulobacter sp. Root1455 TaxID=1736465 RepID=UPI0012E33D64|nr:hypothetical protein [Caulobacter sp. Root1455]
MKVLASIILGAAAALSVWVLVGMLKMLPIQGEKDQAYFRQFEQAAKIVDSYSRENGKLPDDPTFGRLVGRPDGMGFFLTPSSDGSCEGFTKGETDRFVLSLWRGEWSECFAYPSERTTLALSRWDQLRGFGPQLVVLCLLAAVALWAMAWLWKASFRHNTNPG